MSHNENTPERSARRHSPALIAIVAALLLAGIAALVFGWMNGRPEPVGEHAPASDAGNPSSFSIRGLGPQTGTFGPKIVLKNGAGTVLSTLTPTPCAFGAVTVIPSFSCGLG